MRRCFLIKASKTVTAPIFNLRCIAGTSGRLDVILRSFISALICDDEIRKDTEIYAVLEGPPNPPLIIAAFGSGLNNLPQSEVGLAIIFQKLMQGERIKGFRVLRKSFSEILKELIKDYTPLYLHEKGKDIRELSFTKNSKYLFILGDHIGLDRKSEELISKLGIPWVSLGPIPYLTSQCITLIHEEIDRVVGRRTHSI